MIAVPIATAFNGDLKMTKYDKRAAKRFKDRYGHFGAGSAHTRTASEAEVRGHIRKIKEKRSRSK